MLTKSELTKKKSKDSEQLDLVEEISSEEKLRRKRRWLYFTIAGTIGLSLIFWIYRVITTVQFSLPSMPQLSLPVSSESESANDIYPSVNRILKDYPSWSIAVGPPPSQNWNKNQPPLSDSQVEAAYAEINTQKPTSESMIKDYLPQGLAVKEKFTTSGENQSLNSLVVTPEKEILFMISIHTSDQEKFKSVLSELIPVLYWESIK